MKFHKYFMLNTNKNKNTKTPLAFTYLKNGISFYDLFTS